MREFNTTGNCVRSKHYMVDTSNKINAIIELIEKEKYFVINRPRQYGKTTTLGLLRRKLNNYYLIINISLEDTGKNYYKSEEHFIKALYEEFKIQLELNDETNLLVLLEEIKDLDTFKELSRFITKFIKSSEKEVILMIDEVEKEHLDVLSGTNNDVFIKFLSMLRSKYLKRNDEVDYTFKSVILAGVHDIKNLKYKMHEDSDSHYNSPWNIATDFNIDMSFNEEEIKTLLIDYLSENSDVSMDIDYIASRIHYFTNGHPFLVSYLCKIIDEQLNSVATQHFWSEKGIEEAIKIMLISDNTNFDSLIQNIANNKDLYNLVWMLLIEGAEMPYSISAPAMKKGLLYGVTANDGNNRLIISNKIYSIIIYQYLMDRMKTESEINVINQYPMINFITDDGHLDIDMIMDKYIESMKNIYDDTQNDFIEKNARLLFSMFVRPIINGKGFMYFEPVISDRKRLDIIITYNNKEYIVELKIWNGPKYFNTAKDQLYDYLDRRNLNIGYLLIHDFRKVKHKRFTKEIVEYKNKQFIVIYV